MKVDQTMAVLLWCRQQKLPEPVLEYKFAAPERRWAFDLCWPEQCIALEIEGGAWTGGRHTRGRGFIGDIEKYNHATIAGWRVIRATPQQVKSGQAFDWLELILRG